MQVKFLISCALFLLLIDCKNNTDNRPFANTAGNTLVANRFVDAFYSFNKDSLSTILSQAKSSQPNIMYYQKWAECAHYKVLNRDNFIGINDSIVIFPVTVKDDLMAALNIDFNVTDTFHLSIRDGMIRSVETASNDLDVYYEAKAWVKTNRPDLIERPCAGIWSGGPTPCECVLGMLKGFAEFTAARKGK